MFCILLRLVPLYACRSLLPSSPHHFFLCSLSPLLRFSRAGSLSSFSSLSFPSFMSSPFLPPSPKLGTYLLEVLALSCTTLLCGSRGGKARTRILYCAEWNGTLEPHLKWRPVLSMINDLPYGSEIYCSIKKVNKMIICILYISPNTIKRIVILSGSFLKSGLGRY